MPLKFAGRRWRNVLVVAGALMTGALMTDGSRVVSGAQAQGLDMNANPGMPAPTAGRLSSLDMDVNPSSPLATSSAVQASPQDNAQRSIRSLNTNADAAAPPTPEGPPADTRTAATERELPTTGPRQPMSVTLDHPKVVDTARLEAGDTVIKLYGIEGLAGPSAQGLQAFIAAGDGRVTCQALPGGSFVCLMSDGTNVAQVALVNGAARTVPDAPDSYREQEVAAQAARRGIWVNLPPPPETVIHPIVRDTATLWADGKTYVLDGVAGFQVPYSSQLQGYISANGDSMTCSPQRDPGHYVCLLPDGTDVAGALVNGAARVGPDAPDAYRLQQLDALNNRRGYWLTAPDTVVTAATRPPEPQVLYTLVSGDDGVDGVTYIGGAPVAMIAGEPVFLVYGNDDLGWGYYDHYHHWHGAPDRYRNHMEHFHPGGHGLRGYDGFHRDAMMRGHDEAMRHDAVMRGHEEAMRHDSMMRAHEEAVRYDAGARAHEEAMRHDSAMRGREEAMHAGIAGTAGHPSGAVGAGHSMSGAVPGAGGPAAVGHTGNIAMNAGHPGTAGGPPGGGFVHPAAAASAGGFHPGGMAAPATHAAAPAQHAAAPAPHPAAPSGGGARHK